jgi:hypothetical protein
MSLLERLPGAAPADAVDEAKHPVPGVNKWHTFAGGTFAKEGKHSYKHESPHGEYHVNPISARHNSNRHIGYSLQFAHTKGTGKLPHGGLWHDLGMHGSPQAAASAARRHHDQISGGKGVNESMSLKDRLGARALTEQDNGTATPASPAETPPKNRPLLEDLIASRPLRFFSARDIQYAIEDLATAAERFKDRPSYKYGGRRKDSCEDEKKGKELLTFAQKELRDAAGAFKKYADHCEDDDY